MWSNPFTCRSGNRHRCFLSWCGEVIFRWYTFWLDTFFSIYHNDRRVLFTRCQFCMVTYKLPPSTYSCCIFITHYSPSLAACFCISHHSPTNSLCTAVYGTTWKLCMGCLPISSQRSLPTSTKYPFPILHRPSPLSLTLSLHPLSCLTPLCLHWAGMWWWHWCVLFLFPLFTNRRRPDWSMPTLRSLYRAYSLKRPKLRNSKES